MARRKRMSDDDLATKVDSQIADAQLYGGTDRDKIRELALKFFDGETDLPAMGKHGSQVVSRDVSDIHGLIMPSLLRVFFGSDRIVSYEPTRTEHEEYADQASDLVNYVVMRECEGYRNFRSAISDGLLLGNGIVKHWWDNTPDYTTDTYSALTEDQYRMVISDADVEEILEHETYADPDWVAPPPPPPAMMMSALLGAMEAPPAPGMPPAPMMATAIDPSALVGDLVDAEDDERQTGDTKDTSEDDADPRAPRLHDFKVKRIRSNGRLQIAAVPHEEFIIERRATALDETVRFCAHVRRTTRSELVKEGYPRDKVDEIPLSNDMERDASRRARDDSFDDADVSPDQSTQLVDVYECYVLIDTDGDGIAERRRIVMGGLTGKRSILANDEWGDDLPFSDIVPNPRAHAWRGKGLYEELGDIQRIKTVVLRGVLNNAYQNIAPQRAVVIGDVENMDEVLEPTPDGIILLKKAGAMPPAPVQIPFIADKLLPLMDIMDAVGEKRTGASQRTSALDMNALQNQSATAVNVVQAAVQTKNEEYARNIAECGGMQRIFRCILRLITKHQDHSKMVRLHGKLVEIDPRSWNADMDVTINIGLGTGSRDRDLAALSAVAAKQEQIIGQFGPFNEQLNVGHLTESYQKMAEAAGIRNPEAFFPSISQEQVAQLRQQAQEAGKGQPDPKMMEAQAKLQIRQQEMQFEQQAKVAEFQMTQQSEEARATRENEIAQAKLLMDTQNRQAEASLKLQLMREEAAARLQLLREENEAKLLIAREEAGMRQEARYREMDIESQLSQIAMALKVNLNTANIARPE